MRLALIASVLASAGALAGCEAGVRTSPNYARVEPARVEPAPRPSRASTRWVTLADRNSAQSKRQDINTRGEMFRTIRIEADRGAPVIKQVAIEFSDDIGNPQVIRIDAAMPAGQGQTIDLNGGRRAVQRIIVYCEPSQGGSYSVLGA